MDIQTLVKTVIRTFEDAASLVRRIQQKQNESIPSDQAHDPATDLLNSLMLGPMIIRGHYDHDLKRFGEAYACGDLQAREQMKDVLINLQIALLSGLNHASMDDGDINHVDMQAVSDDCRVNAGVCLGQLSQRLSEATRAQSVLSHHTGVYPSAAMSSVASPLQYSSSRSTDSSIFSHGQTLSPSTVIDDFSSMKLEHQPQRRTLQSPMSEEPLSTSSSSSHDPNLTWGSAWLRAAPIEQSVYEWGSNGGTIDSQSSARTSSRGLSAESDQHEKSPHSSPRSRAVEIDRSSQRASVLSGRDSIMSERMHSESQFPADEKVDPPPVEMSADNSSTFTTHWDTQKARSDSSEQSYRTSMNSTSTSDYSTLEHIQYLQPASKSHISDPDSNLPEAVVQSHEPEHNFPPPPSEGRLRTFNPTDQSLQQIPMEYSSRPSVSAPIPVESKIQAEEKAQTQPNNQETQFDSQSISSKITDSAIASPTTTLVRSFTATTTTSSLAPPLILPTENNTLGFCRGAFRLLIGFERKAFTIHNRPLGLSSVQPYWKCEKCTFEGPCVMVNTPVSTGRMKLGKKMKAEKTFDTAVRKYRGNFNAGGEGGIAAAPIPPVTILYKWAFLAKCHINIKSMPEGREQRKGEYGSFGCIFCACEARRRSWNVGGNDLVVNSSSASIVAGAGAGAAAATLIFGNVASFMEHLQVHRREDMWPGAEMCGRVKAIVGRMPDNGEDFDLALLPL